MTESEMSDPLAGDYLDVWRRPDGRLEVRRFDRYRDWADATYVRCGMLERGWYHQMWKDGSSWWVNSLEPEEGRSLGHRITGAQCSLLLAALRQELLDQEAA